MNPTPNRKRGMRLQNDKAPQPQRKMPYIVNGKKEMLTADEASRRFNRSKQACRNASYRGTEMTQKPRKVIPRGPASPAQDTDYGVLIKWLKRPGHPFIDQVISRSLAVSKDPGPSAI